MPGLGIYLVFSLCLIWSGLIDLSWRQGCNYITRLMDTFCFLRMVMGNDCIYCYVFLRYRNYLSYYIILSFLRSLLAYTNP